MISDDDLAAALREFMTRANRAMDKRMREDGVSFARYKLLHFIGREQGLRSADIASAFGYSPRTVTEALDALEREGLAARTPDPVDRRVKRISITPAGQAALDASQPARARFLEQLFATLGADERTMVAEIFARLNLRLEQLS